MTGCPFLLLVSLPHVFYAQAYRVSFKSTYITLRKTESVFCFDTSCTVSQFDPHRDMFVYILYVNEGRSSFMGACSGVSFVYIRS